MLSLLNKTLPPAKTESPAHVGDIASVNPFYLDLLTPSYMSDDDPDRKTIAIGNTVRTLFYLKDSVETLDPNWFRCAYERPGSIQTFVMVPADKEKLARALDHSDARQGVSLVQGGSASQMEQAERTRDSNRAMLRIMGDYNEPAFDCAIIHQNIADTRECLTSENKALMGLCTNLTMEPCVGQQMEAFWAASPFWSDDNYKDFIDRFGRDIFASTIAAAVPFSDNSVDDGVGSYLGSDPTGSICRLDMQHTSPGRPNTNCFMGGSSGSGKTTAIQSIISQDLAQGAKVIVVDYERTFKRGCQRAHGQWIDMGRGAYTNAQGKTRGAWLCPLEPRVGIADVEEGEDAEDDKTVLRPTLTYLHIWAGIMWGLDSDQMRYLEDGLRAAYAKYGIDYTTTYDEVKKDGYPTFDDLAEVFDELEEAEARESDKKIYHKLAKASRDCGLSGTYGQLFGRRSNVDVTSDFVVFDIYELSEAEDNVRAAQLQSIASWLWSLCTQSRKTGQFIRIVYDEVHLFFNAGGTNEQASMSAARFLNSCQKRIRKYNGGLCTATQNLGDILDPSVRRFGEALITSSTYKFFFHTDGTDLAALTDTMKLTDHVSDMIGTGFERGDCLMCAGTTRSRMHFDLTPYIADFWAGK